MGNQSVTIKPMEHRGANRRAKGILAENLFLQQVNTYFGLKLTHFPFRSTVEERKWKSGIKMYRHP